VYRITIEACVAVASGSDRLGRCQRVSVVNVLAGRLAGCQIKLSGEIGWASPLTPASGNVAPLGARRRGSRAPLYLDGLYLLARLGICLREAFMARRFAAILVIE
jgi:hypothetical protein